MGPLVELFESATKEYSRNIFVRTNNGVALTYGDVRARVMNRTDELARLGISAGDMIMISEGSGIATLELLMACFYSKACAVLADPNIPERQLEYLAEREGVSLLFRGEKVVSVINPALQQPPPAELIVFTSGSVKSPRGVMFTQERVLSNILRVADYIPLESQDVALVTKALHHISPLTTQVFLSMLRGSSVLLIDGPRFPRSVARIIAENRVTYIDSIPTLLRYTSEIIRAASSPSSHVRFVSINGEHVPPAEWIAYSQTFPRAKIFYSYGLTEAGPRVSFLEPEYFSVKPGSVGKPVRGMKVSIDKKDSSQAGEILVYSDGLALGYWNNWSLTQEKFVNGWLRTGDVGLVDNDGFLFVKGRVDDAINVGGQNVFPQDIEDVLRELSFVQDCLVTTDFSRRHIVAYVIRQGGCVREMFRYLREKLPPYMIPQEIIECHDLPLSNSGKRASTVENPVYVKEVDE